MRLRPGASMATFLRTASALAKRYPATGGQIVVISLSDEVAAAERAIRPEAVALAVFAGLAGLIGLAVISQLLARQLILDADEFPILRALGMTRASLVVLSLARLAAVTVAGAVIAVACGHRGLAADADRAGPPGRAAARRGGQPGRAGRRVGRDRGAAAGAAGAGGVAGGGAGARVRWAWPSRRHARPSRLGSALGRAGSLPGSIGVRMAFEPGRGRTAVSGAQRAGRAPPWRWPR